MDIKVLGIDLGKTVCSLAGLDEFGTVVFRKNFSGIDCWIFWKGFHLVLLQWRPAAARITSGAFVLRMVISLG